MIKTSILSILLLLIISTIQPVSIRAQFGIKKGVPISLPQQDGDGMMTTGVGDELADAGGDNFLSEKDAADMSAIIEEARRDLETMAMITRMKEENGESLSELKKMTTTEVLGGMKQALDNMKLIEYLFEDKERAVREMEKEGMIDKAHIKKYRKDPELLEQDTRRGLYFQFISLAVVGGFIE